MWIDTIGDSSIDICGCCEGKGRIPIPLTLKTEVCSGCNGSGLVKTMTVANYPELEPYGSGYITRDEEGGKQ